MHRTGSLALLAAFVLLVPSLLDDATSMATASNEPRELIIGHSGNRRLFVVSFTEREGRVRIISARRATKRERQDYEQNSK